VSAADRLDIPDPRQVDVTFIVDVKVNPGSAAEFIAATKKNMRGSRLEPGCVRFDIMQDPEDENSFKLYEAYQTPEDITTHKSTEHYKAWATTVESMMAAPRSKTVLKTIC